MSEQAPADPPRERKSRWDAPAPGAEAAPANAPPAAPPVTAEQAQDAATKAAEIAAKIAASLRPTGSSGQELVARAKKPEGEFVKDIEVNDLRNRYVLTKAATQKQIEDETGASIETKGVWVPDRTRMPPGEMPLYLHITAKSQIVLDAAVKEVMKLVDQELGPLIEERTLIARARARGEVLPPGIGQRPKWPEEKLFIGLEPLRNFNVRAKVVGPGGMFVKHIQAETGARVQIKGRGSGFLENETGREGDDEMHISIVAPTDDQIQRAKTLAEDLLMILRIEYDKARNGGGRGDYGGEPYPVMGGNVSAAQQGTGYSEQTYEQGGASSGAPAGSSEEQWQQYLAYYASMGYDVNDPQFQQWMREQQAQAGGAPAS
ncbi:hypothetical protein CC85DRAFT_286958 [Cutaneotrichosporon oleaginosum]|uniref:K Homology domain-containing protein n=1 Tax=Cutaneotrichosporon oleaginosum TaxID=879819 RepID=A0A0J0XIL2_9TREE|nr:uncharacterized protein CC85DRAFT_286958 [Cutaneotrichosporon oleaginosum]KLT40913.1 hypothetical protein CC85DRAFT_286958 [Cutaneotrichosporon oleaginosum]TXT15406.1 hypothetical protein COLE_01599 [Cutaneotrichosporon oleaginosum]